MFAWEGCVTANDLNGDLKFYSNGMTVWNANHDTLLNGDSLLGWFSTTQSCIAMPNSDYTKWLLVTLNGHDNYGGQDSRLCYSVIDMSLDGGLGGVISGQKNILLDSFNLVETLSGTIGTFEAEGEYWFVTRTKTPEALKLYHVDQNLTIELFDSIYLDNQTFNSAGCATFSPSGELLAVVDPRIPSSSRVWMLKFNASTGSIEKTLFFHTSITPYGVEFSPNEKLLYLSGSKQNVFPLCQYSIQSYDEVDISSSETQFPGIAAMFTGMRWLGALELTPQKQIMAATYFDSVGRIKYPNISGTGCEWDTSAISLNGNVSRMGLPNQISGMVYPQIFQRNYCFGDSMEFRVYPIGFDSVSWNFGDVSSGATNLSSLFKPNHVFTSTGLFQISAIVHYPTFSDTLIKDIRIIPIPSISIQDTLVFCKMGALSLDTHYTFSYTWSNGSDSNSIEIDSSGLYFVTVFNVCGRDSDSTFVIIEDTLKYSIGSDTILCANDSIIIDPIIINTTSFLWSTGDTISKSLKAGSFLSIDLKPISIWLEASNACGTVSDTIEISFLAEPKATLPSDTINCFEQSFYLERPNDQGVNYTWNDTTSYPEILIVTDTQLVLHAFNICGIDRDSITINFYPEIKVELGRDTTLCPGDSVALNASWTGSTYQWSSNVSSYNDSLVWVGDEGNYVVTITKGPCILVEQKQIFTDTSVCDNPPCKFEVSNVITPNGDGLNDILRVRNLCADLEFHTYIFNRWGQLVWESTSSNFAWDGTINGAQAAEGTYFVKIHYRLKDMDKYVKTTLTLLR